MSAQVSPSTNKPYGIQRVCTAWAYSRSSFYARRKLQEQAGKDAAPKSSPRKRGSKPAICDENLLNLIRKDLDESPFHGEGHRKVWARLRVLRGVRVSRNRVLRLMRENGLLSPYRRRKHSVKAHDGEIITHEPNVMWGTDGTKVLTVDDGWVWGFAAVEHWNAECVGWHVSKRGDRFAALEPVGMALTNLFGSTDADAGRGLSLRMDNGTQYLSDHFQNQIRWWGIAPSFAFVEQPQTNGVAERFFKTLKEQVIYGRIFRNIEEVREAVGSFIEQYNEHWRLEKLDYQTPLEARKNYLTEAAA